MESWYAPSESLKPDACVNLRAFLGFMKHLPNLLKQESSSAATLVHILLRMYYDPRPEHQTARPQVAERLLP